MARKAGPGDGTEDGREEQSTVSPEGSSFLPDARLADEPEEFLGSAASDSEKVRTDTMPDENLDADSSSEPLPARGEEELRETAAAGPEDENAAWSIGNPPEPQPETDASSPFASMNAAATGSSWPGSVGEAGTSDGNEATTSAPAVAAEPARASAFEKEPKESRSFGTAPAAEPSSASPRRSGVGPLLLGGVIAAALGFGAAWLAREQSEVLSGQLPGDLEERLVALEARPVETAEVPEDLEARLQEAEARLATLEDAPSSAAEAVDLEPLRQEFAQGFADAQADNAEVEERIAALEARLAIPEQGEAAADPGPAVRPPPPVDPDALRAEVLAAIEPRLAETESGLEEVRTALSDAQAALDDLAARLERAEGAGAAAAEEARAAAESLAEAEARAAAAEAQARARAALGEVEAALAAGEAFEEPLSELQAAEVSVPDALAQLAGEGAPPLAELRDAFPQAARDGLAAARDEGLLDDGSGVMGFLRGQLSLRSVAPREGEDPDAILSRVEARLAAGQLDAALSEIEALPEPVRNAMTDWITLARTRAQADAALTEVRDSLPAPDASQAD